LVILAALAAATASAAAVSAAIVSYDAGELNFVVDGAGTVTVVAQIDFKYISDVTGAEALARAVSEPLKVQLAGGETKGTINFTPPAGTLLEAEVVLFVNGAEKARQTFYY